MAFTKVLSRLVSGWLRLLIPAALLASMVLAAMPMQSAMAQSAIDGFNPDANNAIRVMAVQPDGKILVGGISPV